MAKVDLRNRRPKVERLPDDRERATFSLDVLEWVGRTKAEILAEVWLAWGTEAPAEYSGLRLIKQDLEGLTPNENGSLPLIRIYEELHATAETQVGENAVQALEDGRKAVVAEFLQFSAATATPGTVGTTTAPGDASAFLQNEEAPSDGALRRIKRTYVYAGTISTDDQSLNGGALLKKVVVSVKTVPSTPAGYTLVGSPVQSPNGLPVYTYSFYKGDGEISRDIDPPRYNGMLQRVIIRHLTALTVTVQPTTDPLAGGAVLGTARSDEEGHRLWTVTWQKVSGASLIRDETEQKHQGKLVVYRRSRLNTQPDTPAATIGGTVVEISSGSSLGDGFTIYDKTCAEGLGVIDSSRSLRHKGKLVIYRFTSLGVAPTTPAATIGGTVVLMQDDDRESDGVTIYDRTWAEGKGVVGKRSQPRDGGLRLETWESLGDTYDASFMKPVGVLMAKDYDDLDGATRWTVTCMQKSDGSALDFSIGQVLSIAVTNGGNSYTTPPTVTLAAPPAGGVQATATAVLTGNTVTSVTVDNPGSGYLTAPSVSFSGGGGAEAAATATIDGPQEFALEFEIFHPFDYPGRAKVTLTTLNTYKAYDVFKSPPIRVDIPATVRVSYQTENEIGALPFPHWNPEEWTTIFAKHKVYPDGWPHMIAESLPGYRAISQTAINHDGGLVGALLVTQLGERVAQAPSGTPYSIQLSGGPEDPEGTTYVIAKPDLDPAFVALDGTQYYRKTLIIAEIPAQPALPV